jgi:hypothetical protein
MAAADSSRPRGNEGQAKYTLIFGMKLLSVAQASQVEETLAMPTGFLHHSPPAKALVVRSHTPRWWWKDDVCLIFFSQA